MLCRGAYAKLTVVSTSASSAVKLLHRAALKQTLCCRFTAAFAARDQTVNKQLQQLKRNNQRLDDEASRRMDKATDEISSANGGVQSKQDQLQRNEARKAQLQSQVWCSSTVRGTSYFSRLEHHEPLARCNDGSSQRSCVSPKTEQVHSSVLARACCMHRVVLR